MSVTATSTARNAAIAPRSHQTFIQLLEQLYRERALLPYAAGRPLPLRDNEILVICRGIVQLFTLQQDGSETLLGLVGPSMPLGLPLTIVDPYWATALTDVDVLALPMAEIESSSVLMAGMFRNVTLRMQQAEAWLALSGKRLVADRLKHFLLLLAKDFGQVEPSGIRIPIRLTHHQLAAAIGTTRVTVTRLLKDFKSEGWLTIDQRQVVLQLDPRFPANQLLAPLARP
ncbi:Crp/Fnr family transcriptional regulator [Nodosilinea sp. E11]|uniref:Crp/Fnr family transcriptional regulator n=1 Tax=Nodosilinea sp. E11 TaxID=3037479 RepID=UPI00293470F9|nr:Crp/Fnr family transcriptional regulator [Nodosilinea sp. E11]WOD40712.1 Crp/Fnr family transcriptional regulator [Nodosilinea sp. E11]